ncbi:glycoside hydrolase family 18 protein [Teredinibacter sp. KSP-S5-2]|uniref:glycoside hydrolase family 18 protein n=1 Tax=Teredinibacter sp. KSP-S5-2 TaxID=3034506 RepID=UPI00293515FD|nr:glycoside hydrolase family 18 protein [Teredinibacter sp. KSP-S5-2]WNO08347.1 glycoside hydrolase family 18 protein [Teredinibacter sp. KSP-S5-2]
MNTRLVTYYNNGSQSLDQAISLPYTDVILAFIFSRPEAPLNWQLGGGIAATSTSLTSTTRQAIQELHEAGKKVLISFGGGEMSSAAYQALVGHEDELAKSIADFVQENQLDGVDIDWEDTGAFTGVAGYSGVNFLISLTKNLRESLPAEKFVISHAPQPPYLQQGSGMDGYIQVMAEVGLLIDWLNVQFYNNHPWSSNPEQIIAACKAFSALPGITAEKILVGLPVTEHDAGSGYLPIATIVEQVITPLKAQGDFGGMMNWQFSSDQQYFWAREVGRALGLK